MNKNLNFPAIQKYSKDYAAKLCDEFFSRNEIITGKKIMNLSNINQVNLFSIKHLSDKWQEEMSNLKSPYFNYEQDDIQKSLTNLMNLLSQNIAVKREHFEPILIEATESTLMLLMHPLEYFGNVLNDLPNLQVSSKDLKQIEKFTQINKIVPNIVIDKINVTGSDFVYVNSATKWMEEIPKISLDQPERYISLFAEKVPVSIDDFIEKNEQISIPKKEAETVIQTEKIIETSSSFFENIATGEQSLSEVKTPIFEETKIEEKPSILTPFEKEPEVTKIIAPEHPVFMVEQPKNFTFEPLPSFKNEDLTLNERIVKTENLNDKTKASETINDLQSKSKIEGITSVISLNQRFLFINRLFGGNFDYFQHAIDELELCKDYSEAKELILKKYVTKFNWDVTSNEAEEFFEILKRRFS